GRFVVKTIIEVVESVIIGLISIIIASIFSKYVAETIGKAIESSMPGLGVPVAIISGLLSAAIVGIAIGYFARALWGSFTKAINAKRPVIERED
ncbi:MAG: hypothetical protein WBM17_07650, partial [Anaerolineales bacterium]